MRKLRLEVICSKLHSYHEVDLGIKLIFVWFLIIANRPSWHGHLWRIQHQGQSCPLSRGKWGRLSIGLIIKKGHLNGDKLNSIVFSELLCGKQYWCFFWLTFSLSKCSHIISWEAQGTPVPPCLRKRPRELSKFLKITKPRRDGT